MKIKFCVLLIISSISIATFAQQNAPIPKSPLASADSVNALQKTSTNTKGTGISLPYPILFIHGLNSDASTWDDMIADLDATYGTVCGGRYDFCLNYDGDLTNANLNFWPDSGADLCYFTPTVSVGDYYLLNFGMGSDGSVYPSQYNSYYVESEQSAITKQGLALKWAIYFILQLTGRDKVILMGHSMGGLCAREYLENQNLWQSDGQHHVAKLVTTGTPHGGSDAYGPNLLTGVFKRSDAVRDLKTSFSNSGDSGVYLFGGVESNSVMDDFISGWFDNVDVNCDGITGQTIVGLNQKNLYTNLDYACIIGECTSCLLGQELPGDGVVNNYKADLNNYYPNITNNVFYYSASSIVQIHTSLPDQTILNLRALDEPDNYNLAYAVEFDSTYMGFTSMPATTNTNYPTDIDLYRFTVTAHSNVKAIISNLSISDFSACFMNSNYQIIGTLHTSNGATSMEFTQSLTPGTYYLKVFGQEQTDDQIDTYNFCLKKTIISDLNESDVSNNTEIYPNPSNGIFELKSEITNGRIVITDIMGIVVFETTTFSGKTTIDLSALPDGIYFATIERESTSIVKKIIKGK